MQEAYDYIVVGGGPAGIIVAERLSTAHKVTGWSHCILSMRYTISTTLGSGGWHAAEARMMDSLNCIDD